MFRIAQFVFFLLIFPASHAFAQVEAPDPEQLYYSDSNQYQENLEARKQQILKVDPPVSSDLQIEAPVVDYVSEKEKVRLQEGLLLSQGNLQLRADEGVVSQKKQSANLLGDVYMGWPGGSIAAESAKVFLETETGEFKHASLYAEQSDFLVTAKNLKKISEFDYIFQEPTLTPCQCSDGSVPWSISCSELKVREEGYGRAKDFKFKVNDRPVLYLPYMIFPVKRERQSGFLVPEIGFSNRDGFRLSAPYFLDVNESTDLLFRPFTQSRTRTGLAIDYNQVYSQKSNLQSRIYYSDESARDGESRGTITSDLFDPTIDDNRLAGFLTQSWRSGPESPIPLSLVSDIHLVSDDLALRELSDDEIGRYNARFTTSRTALRTSFGQLLSAELSGEFNQSILTDDDLIFQRAPELNLSSQRSFRPFGQNPYGIKLIAANNIQAVNFIRNTGFEGARYDINPSIRIPYHYKNYLNGNLEVEGNFTSYNLSNAEDPNDPTQIVADDNRNVYTVRASVGTELEKVYPLDQKSSLVWLTSLGRGNQSKRLSRIKHTIEPNINLTYVPDEDQDDLPLFDSLDRIRERELIGAGFKSSIFGRFEPTKKTADSILELAPQVDRLPSVTPLEQLSDPAFSAGPQQVLPKPIIDRGEVRELANLSLYQTYSNLDNQGNSNSPWSDLAFDFGVFPSNYFAMRFDSNIDIEDQDLSSWGTSAHFRDDRGDLLRLRYSFIEDNISQLEANLELALSSRLKLGYYARYDERENEFIDNQIALRIASSCNCWDLDIGFRERLNPDNKDFILQLTLKGLGALTQGVSLLEDQNR